jgi:hypothetical protein
MNPLIRQLKIALIIEEPNEIIDWFNDLWSKLSIVETNVYHEKGGEFIYYMGGEVKQWIFFQDNKNDRFYCNFDHYWSVLESKIDLEYGDNQEITKFLVENALNNRVSTPGPAWSFPMEIVENALNNRVSTPVIRDVAAALGVENALNNRVSTPIVANNPPVAKVKNALNNRVTSSANIKTVENVLNNRVTTP